MKRVYVITEEQYRRILDEVDNNKPTIEVNGDSSATVGKNLDKTIDQLKSNGIPADKVNFKIGNTVEKSENQGTVSEGKRRASNLAYRPSALFRKEDFVKSLQPRKKKKS